MKSRRKIFHPSSAFRLLSSVLCRPSSIVPRPPALHSPSGVGGSSTGYFMAIFLLLCACPTLGVIEFKDGLTHDIDHEINDYVYVDYQTPNMYTTVNCLDGARIDYPSRLMGYENSRINVSGGWINSISLSDSSQVNISGGEIINFYSRSSGQINMSGGEIFGWLQSGGSSQVNITGGQIRAGLYCDWFSQVYVYDGSIGDLDCRWHGQVDIYGGSIHGDWDLWNWSKIQIFGFDFAVDGQPFGYGELTSILGSNPWDEPWNEPWRHLTGTLVSGGLIDADFRIGNDARIVLTIPEPATVLLLGLGGLIFLRRRKTKKLIIDYQYNSPFD